MITLSVMPGVGLGVGVVLGSGDWFIISLTKEIGSKSDL